MDVFFQAPATRDSKGAGSYHDASLLSSLDKSDPKKIGGLFEAMFYRMIFKEMRNSSLGDPLASSFNSQQVREMHDDELANQLGAQGHLGVVKMIEDYTQQMDSDNVVNPKDFNRFFGQPLGLLKDTV